MQEGDWMDTTIEVKKRESDFRGKAFPLEAVHVGETINDFEVIARRNQIERLEKILNYINENYDKEINLGLAAQKFYMNTSYFSDYFKKNKGINFTVYLAKVRINKAVRLLTETDISTTEIAFSCGFNNITSFYNTFKNIIGMSPGDYKKNSTKA